MTRSILIVGSGEDPHVAAVAACLDGSSVVLFDVERLKELRFAVGPAGVRLGFDGRTVDLSTHARGWIRRLSPVSWEEGVSIGSHEAVSKASWLSLLASVLRNPATEWLSTLDAVNSAESKLVQYWAAGNIGVPIPETSVTNDLKLAPLTGGRLIAKPLGPGHFRTDDGQWLTVFTESFDPGLPSDLELLKGPPFILQEALDARAHLRVVTVGDRAWVFRLDADGLPIDWREEPRAHREWAQFEDARVERFAVQLAAELDVRYSSQDWIQTENSVAFIDLNPSGQWLFLPDPGAAEITHAIADWLAT